MEVGAIQHPGRTLPKVLVYFSNPQIFESALLDGLESLAARLEMMIIVQGLQHGSDLEARLQDLAKKTLSCRYTTIAKKSRQVSAFQPAALTQLTWELVFWSRHVRGFLSHGYDAVIIHSETLLSDFVAASMAPSPKCVLVLHPNRPFRESQMKLEERLASRLRTLVNTLFRMGLQNLLRQLNYGLQAAVYRRLVRPTFRFLTGKSMSEMQIARWWVDGRNFGCYVVEPGRELRTDAGQETPIFSVNYEFAPENQVPASSQSTAGLLLLGGPDVGWLPDEVQSICSDVFYLAKVLQFPSVVIRPHPRYRWQATEFVLELSRLGLKTSVSPDGKSLRDDVIEATGVFGTNSSSLLDCLTWAMDRPVIGIDDYSVKLMNFQRPKPERILWLDRKLRDPTKLTEALRNQPILGTDAPQTKLSTFIEDFVWRVRFGNREGI